MMPAGRRPAARRRRRLRAAIIAAVLVMVTAGAGIARLGRHAVSGAPPGTGRPGTSSPAVAVPPPATPARAPVISLAGMGWTDFHGVELPVSRSAGPRYIRGGLASGFADTPLGALLAAVNIGVRANAQWGPAIFAPTIRDQVTGPGTAQLLTACQVSYDQARRAAGLPAGQILGRAYVSEEAFRWVTYTPADATVDIVSAGPATQGGTARAVTRIEVAWSVGDWRAIAPPGGDWGNSAAALTSLSGYTTFPAPAARKGTPR